MPHVLGLTCVRCDREQAAPGLAAPAPYLCPCGGNLRVTYDTTAIASATRPAALAASRDRTLWRWRDLLPVSPGALEARLAVGGTPLAPAPHLAADLGLSRLWLKDDTGLPSASFKDRASAVVLAVAAERGERVVAAASTGNAASSLSCLAARTGTRTVIFVPEAAPPAKLAQTLIHGATVIAVRGTYDDAFDLCVAACAEHGWYNRNTGYNPFTREGKKTCAFEIAEQLGWRAPDWVAVPTGDGNILSGIHAGFTQLHELGWIDRRPRLLACQAGGSDAIQRAVDGDGELRPATGHTLADSIAVRVPRDGEAAVRAIRESEGAAVLVSDEAVLEAMAALGRREGRFAEPAAATSVAGLADAVKRGLVDEDAAVVALITGSGLKDVASASRAAGAPIVIEPTLEALDHVVHERIEA